MASSDVIELGSSEDEAEPVPKKKRPTPNAMVKFPKEVTGLVLSRVKHPIPNLQKVIAGGAITITNVKEGKAITQINKAKPNGRPVQPKSVLKPQLRTPVTRHIQTPPIRVKNNLTVNPFNVMKNTANVLRGHTSKLSLPPGIIVKRAALNQKPLQNLNSVPNRKKHILKRIQPCKIITTVDLDDDEVPLTSGTSPLWYLRPEEETAQPAQIKKDEPVVEESKVVEKLSDLEVENNREPDATNYIEITIEDSPIKPIQIMKGFEVGSQISITIEDSPVKPAKSVTEQPCVSDGEAEQICTTEPQSKKKLEYPKNEDNLPQEAQNVVEIDLEIVPSVNEVNEKSQDENNDLVDKAKEDIELQKGVAPERVPTVLITKELKDKGETSNLTSTLPLEKNYSSEFHPTYQKFIDLCFKLENSDDMKKIVEKKIETYYRQCPREYVESEEFIDMVSSKIFAMKAAPDKMYLYIKDIVDELNLQRKTAKALEVSKDATNKAGNNMYFNAEDVEFDNKRQRQIRKLEKTIKKLHRAVQKLEEQEVEFEDEEDSVYLLTERYKERLIRVHAKFCQLTNTKMPSEPRIQVEPRPGQPLGPARRLEKWVNKKVPIGKPLPFPDFHDVLRCVRDANDEDRLGWNEADIMEEARDLFTRCGKKLQRRRQENEWRIAASRISQEVSSLDPAEISDDLKKKLEENKSFSSKKESELLKKYADKQNQLKLVGEEIGDKEAEESPVESEDDDDESNSLEDKQKRKDMLRRLLQGKTRKLSSEKENIDIVDVKVGKEDSQLKKQEKTDSEVASLLKNNHDNKLIKDINDEIKEVDVIINEPTVDNSQDEVSNVEKDGSNDQNNEKCNNYDTLSLDSDIDELHLLQKLYSENEINSSTPESDTDTPIAISDTLDSGSDTENVGILQNDDIISIENSSYSESEINNEEERERPTVSGAAKDEKIDDLLSEDTEIRLYSFSDKVDVEDEDILLASSGDEKEQNNHLHTDEINKITCEARMSNIIANNNCETVDENCDESSLQNVIRTDVSQSKKVISEKDEMLVEYCHEVNILDNNEGHTNEHPAQSLQNAMEVDEHVSSVVPIEKDNDNTKLICRSRDDLLTKEIACNKANIISTDNKVKGHFENLDNKFEGNNTESNQTNQSCIDKVEINVAPGTGINSEQNKDNLIECVMMKLSNNMDENEEGASAIVETISREEDINEGREVSVMNIEEKKLC